MSGTLIYSDLSLSRSTPVATHGKCACTPRMCGGKSYGSNNHNRSFISLLFKFQKQSGKCSRQKKRKRVEDNSLHRLAPALALSLSLSPSLRPAGTTPEFPKLTIPFPKKISRG